MDQGAAEKLARTIEAALGPLDPSLRAALLEVDRAPFVREVDRSLAWHNVSLPLDTAAASPARPIPDLMREHGSWLGAALQPEFAASGSTISQPLMYMFAFRVLGLTAGARYLELGTGTGYGAALAARVVGSSGCVTSVDVDAGLVARARTAARSGVTFVHADGLVRPDLMAKHDRCWITFSIPAPPATLLEALPEGAQLLAPIGPPPPSPQRYVLYTRERGELRERDLSMPVYFIPARTLTSR